ncbi:hypothetical protein C1H46_042461 [Malus baccata]|uniref:Uncharacterized protein n=1 Tax=Malus baccata TaxID=106549 RepID=A0A540KCP9_MALBA|nr:hypothetical protein C1H46_042461 [Malus baccata]
MEMEWDLVYHILPKTIKVQKTAFFIYTKNEELIDSHVFNFHNTNLVPQNPKREKQQEKLKCEG